MADNDQDTAAESAPSQSLGQTLRSARLAQDLTLEQLATELRIEAKQLAALEEDRFERIGVPVFIKGYLRQYGARLGLNVADLLALYYKQTTLSDVQIQPNRTIKLRDERQITSWVLAAIVLLTVIVGLVVWWWNGGTFAPVPPTASPPATTPGREAAPAEPRAAAAPSLLAVPADGAAAPVDVPVVDAPAAAAPAAEAPAAAAAESPPSPAAPAQQEPIRPQARAAATDSRSRAAPVVTIPLEFTFDAENWVEVSDGRGARVLFGFQAAGRTVTVRGEPPFAVVLGNAGSVRLVVDGEPFAIPTTGRPGDVARFSVDIAEE